MADKARQRGMIEMLAQQYIDTHQKEQPGSITNPGELLEFARWLDRFIAGEEQEEDEPV